ncbi:MAG: nucleoside kinase, partial [Erysipelotrichales bacterium]|nr:nucleoside kinase [Erysipelotrichales bacterium]
IFFNTNYIYEIAVLKKYALPLLKSVERSQKEYAEAQRMLSFLKFFETMEEDQMIANNSILREFIGGSVLVK